MADSGAAETVIPRTWFPSHKTVESEGSKRGVFYMTADGSTVENERENADHVNRRWCTIEEIAIPSEAANVNKAHGSVSKMVRNGNRVVFHTSGSYIENENKMTKNILWLQERRWRVRCGHDGSTPRKRTEEQTAFLGGRHVAGLVCPNEPTGEHGMWDRGELHATDDDEKMDEDKEETDNEEVGVEEQVEEHQKTRAMASPDLPSGREVEDHNLTHIPFRSCCNHLLERERTEERTQEETQ